MRLRSGRDLLERGGNCTSDSPENETATTIPEANEALTEFTLFPKLPPELQIKIWKQAIPPPRLVRVNVRGDVDHIQFSTNVSVPGLFRACRTSRETILKVYTTCLESGDRKIRMDGDNDVLVLFSTCCPGDQVWDVNASWVDNSINYNPLPWGGGQTMLPSQVTMFSGVKYLALPHYVFFDFSVDNHLWLLSQFKSLARYFPLDYCSSNNLNTRIYEIYLTVPEEQLTRLELKTSSEWRAIQWGLHYDEEDYIDEVKDLQSLDLKLDVVLAVVNSERKME